MLWILHFYFQRFLFHFHIYAILWHFQILPIHSQWMVLVQYLIHLQWLHENGMKHLPIHPNVLQKIRHLLHLNYKIGLVAFQYRLVEPYIRRSSWIHLHEPQNHCQKKHLQKQHLHDNPIVVVFQSQFYHG